MGPWVAETTPGWTVGPRAFGLATYAPLADALVIVF